MKFGTILYRYQEDLLHALSAALAHREVPSGWLEQSQNDNTFSKQMNHVCTILNDTMHTSIQKLIEIDAAKPFDVSELDMDPECSVPTNATNL